MSQTKLLLGDEAVAQGALDAGISGAYSYPGTPSTEIMEYIQASPRAEEENLHRQWSSNEKTALEAALGMAYCNKRVLVSMKHVGLNVAADPFVNTAITGVKGGLVLAVADDPSMHSSQNEQDSRYYGKFASVPVLEPANQQEAYHLTRTAFSFSETHSIPVLLRLVTRLAHSRADVEIGDPEAENDFAPHQDHSQYTLIPLNARKNYQNLLDKKDKLSQAAETSRFNRAESAPGNNRGIITAGITYNYLQECKQENDISADCLKISHYPLPREKITEFIEGLKKVLVLEDGQPFIEEFLRDRAEGDLKVEGRLDGTLPRAGELNPDLVASALGLEETSGQPAPDDLPARPPRLCPGCPHADTFEFLKEILENEENARAFSDIGCYTLGFLPPYETIHSCVDMGASITMAKGASDAGLHPSLAVIGDSTFTHSGMTGLLDAVYESSPITVLILDNSTTAMTGGQDSLASAGLEEICEGIGVEPDHLHVLKPVQPEKSKNTKILEQEINYDGVSVLITRRACVQI